MDSHHTIQIPNIPPMVNTAAVGSHPPAGQKPAEVVVLMVPFAGQGHIKQVLDLSQLISGRAIPVHFISTATHNQMVTSRSPAWDPSAPTATAIQFHEVDLPPFDNPLPDPHATCKFPVQAIPMLKTYILSMRKPVHELVRKLSATYRKVVVIYDAFMIYSIQDIESIQNVETYGYHISSAYAVYSMFWEYAGNPDFVASPEAEEIIKEGPSLMEGCFAPEFWELTKLERESKKFNVGDIFNTSRLIEGLYLNLLAKEKTLGNDKIWALGPLHLDPNPNPNPNPNPTSQTSTRDKRLEWLDKQSPNSVILAAFGTTTTFTDEEIAEIAIGLEKSEQKFIWILRDGDKGDISSGEIRKAELPEGFQERVAGRGIVVLDWAPQPAILNHPSTGGFLTHCGWNSTIESLSAGVPMATLPLHSDQPRHAVLITKVLRVGVQIKDWGLGWNQVVPASAVENGVRRLMDSAEGEELRERAREIGRALRESVKENGATRAEFDKFIENITR